MQLAYKCNCTVRALELVVRDFAGLEVRSRSTRPFLFRHGRNLSNARTFGTVPALRIQHSTSYLESAHTSFKGTSDSAEDVRESQSSPFRRTKGVAKPEDAAEAPIKTREANRKDRRRRREAAQKAEEMKRQRAAKFAEKRRLKLANRPKPREEAAESQATKTAESYLETTQSQILLSSSGSPALSALGKNKRKKERRRLAAEAAEAAKAAEAVDAMGPTSTPSEAEVAQAFVEAVDEGSQSPSSSSEPSVPGKNKGEKARKRLAAEATEAVEPTSTLSEAEVAQVLVEAVEADETTTQLQEAKQEMRETAVKTPTLATKDEGVKARKSKQPADDSSTTVTRQVVQTEETNELRRERESWMIQKAALQNKFGEEKWQPRKRISPDALAGIRTLHAQQPEVYTTEVLSNHFKISPEAIRRILKSKWQPDEETAEERRIRWEKRGKKKWEEMVELGIRPPKKWREMGVGRAGKGEKPKWKQGGRPGERWIEHPDTDSFVVAGDLASESAEPTIGDRIV